MLDQLAQVRAYHSQTKHQPERYARSLGFMEWASQPSPFRRYEGAETIRLDHRQHQDGPLYDAVMTGRLPEARPLDRTSLAVFLRDSLALSAWKQMPGGKAWTLRVHPSSGNLHPTEAYLLLPPGAVDGAAALYHYAPYEHALEYRGALSPVWPHLAADLPSGGFYLALSSIFWRESWKYGERAFRYCQHDIGHVIACCGLAAALQGWSVQMIAECERDELAGLLGIDTQEGPEAERAECLLAIVPQQHQQVRDPELHGLRPTAQPAIANRLSPYHHDWPIINDVARATARLARQTGARCPITLGRESAIADGELRSCTARQLIHQRRSAIAMDPSVPLDGAAFVRLCRRLLPDGSVLGRQLPWTPCVSLVLFIHAVEGLDPGLYVLPRSADHQRRLQHCLGPATWRAPTDPALAALGMRLLQGGDQRTLARALSCDQDIAGNGVLTIAMLADFDGMLSSSGPGAYGQMFWECGLIGQICYLEAEGAGLRGCGIGCYLDDGLRDHARLRDDNWQDLYHFAIGAPIEDCRLRSADPYIHLA